MTWDPDDALHTPYRAGEPPLAAYEVPLTIPGAVDVLSPLVRRILAPNPSVMTGQGTNTYLVGPVDGTGDVVVIDPGPDDPVHVDAIVRAGADRISLILITHGHHDHWPGAALVAERTGAKVLAFEHSGEFRVDATIDDGALIETDDFTLETIHTPGHAHDHLCFLLHEERLLFTGDHVMHGSTVVIIPPHGGVGDYLDSLGRLLAWSPPIRALAPAHGLVFTDPVPAIQTIIDHRLAREAKVAAALGEFDGPASVDDLIPATYGDVEERRLPIARYSLWAHLRKLAEDGRATATDPDDLDASRWTIRPTA